MKAKDFEGNLPRFFQDYSYQPDLTRRLDGLAGTQFTQTVINEIVLWKLNRYVSLNDSALEAMCRTKDLEPRHHREGGEVLELLIQTRGIDLPMASAVLRFQNPSVFQIIDRHAYRAVYDKDYPLTPAKSLDKKLIVYFDYLDELHRLCDERDLDFETVDRLLYEFDRKVNGRL